MAGMRVGSKSKVLTHFMGVGTQDMSGIPHPCQYNDLSITEPTKICDESINWLKSLDMKIPIWSRLYPSNCVGYSRDLSFTNERNYCIEIPRRLFSLWGNRDTHEMVIDKMSNLKKYQWVSNVLICCAAVRYNLNDWNPRLLDDIVYRACLIFSELCQKNSITNQEFCMDHMNSVMQFKNTSFRVQIELKAQGFMYISYGYGEYNLARALSDFFLNYQFGLLECQNRCLAFGFATDVEHGYFMYDCQSKGAPLLSEYAANAYVLRTDHLQILLYCLTVATGITVENIPFKIYNVDVVIEDIRERTSRKSLYFTHYPNPNRGQLDPWERKFRGLAVNYNPGCEYVKIRDPKNIEDKGHCADPTFKDRPETDSLLRIGIKGGRIAGGHENTSQPDSSKTLSSEGTIKGVQQSSNPLKTKTAGFQNKYPNDLYAKRGTDKNTNWKYTQKPLNPNVYNKFPQMLYNSKAFSEPNTVAMRQQNTRNRFTKPAEKPPVPTVSHLKAQADRYFQKIQFIDKNSLLSKLKKYNAKLPDDHKSALKPFKPRETFKSSDRRPIANSIATRAFRVENPTRNFTQKDFNSYVRNVTNIANKMNSDIAKSKNDKKADVKKTIPSSPRKNDKPKGAASSGSQNQKQYFKTRSDLDLIELYGVTKPNILGAKVYLVNNRLKKEQSSEFETMPHMIRITKTLF